MYLPQKIFSLSFTGAAGKLREWDFPQYMTFVVIKN